MSGSDWVKAVTIDKAYEWNPESQGKYRVVAMDYGIKYNILRILRRMGCSVTVVPCFMSADEILALKPDGILLSPGPGNPALLHYLVDTIKRLVGKKPIMGICLGCQLIGLAFSATTFKLKFGHRGGNHPVRDLASGRVYIFYDDGLIQGKLYYYKLDSKDAGGAAGVVNQLIKPVPGQPRTRLPRVEALPSHDEEDHVPQFRKLAITKGMPAHIIELFDFAFDLLNKDTKEALGRLSDMEKNFPWLQYYVITLRYLAKDFFSDDENRKKMSKEAIERVKKEINVSPIRRWRNMPHPYKGSGRGSRRSC
jgi:hypothetical protein